MRKVRTDIKPEKSDDLFFESEKAFENRAFGFPNDSEILPAEGSKIFREKLNELLNFIKQVFLFLPGTFILYLIGFVGTIAVIDSFTVNEPMEIFGISSVPFQVLAFGIIALFGTLMTWFGFGDIKNKKHFAIPTSIIAAGGIIAAISKISGDVFGFSELFEVINYYFIYLFPLVLIVPVLVKGWVDQKTEN